MKSKSGARSAEIQNSPLPIGTLDATVTMVYPGGQGCELLTLAAPLSHRLHEP
jgi:hypothetical protein